MWYYVPNWGTIPYWVFLGGALFLDNITFEKQLVIVSALIHLFGGFSYLKDTILGKTKPNRVTWIGCAATPLIGAFAALSQGADTWATVRIFLAGFLPAMIVVASFVNKNSYWKTTKFDLMCGLLSFIALFVWLAASSPRLAIVLVVFGDGFAFLPTILKAWRYPETETRITYVASLLGVLLVIPSIPNWQIENCGFQIYLIVADLAILLGLYRAPVKAAFTRGAVRAFRE